MKMKAIENLKSTLEYLPQSVSTILRRLPSEQLQEIQEIRLRSNRPVCINIAGEDRFLTAQGGLTNAPGHALTVSMEEIARSFQAVCAYSVYSHERDVSEGFVTIRGGCRVGICGTAAVQKQDTMTLRHVSSLNFRIAGEYIGAAQQIWQQIGAEPVSVLVAGPVGSGKTTFLRDLCRLIGNQHRTALVDERGELAGMHRGIPQNDVGIMTDVLDGYSRPAAIQTALRVLSPKYILCDEISTPQDVEAILQAVGCGVQFAASCHAGTVEDVYRRTFLKPLLEAGVFRYCVLLEKAGSVRSVRRLAQR